MPLLLLLLLLGTPALAQGDPEAGRELVRRWCTTCHVVDLEGTGTDAGPALPALLAGKRRSADEIRGWLADPHPPMPNLSLSRREIDDILAYLQSLTGNQPSGLSRSISQIWLCLTPSTTICSVR